MNLEEEISLNKYGQDLVTERYLLDWFNIKDVNNKRVVLLDLVDMIAQSKANDNDITSAITNSKLKPTFTPCVLLAKGVASYNLIKIANLPDNETNKVFVLFISLFKVAYQRRFKEEYNHSNKWWYWNLSNDEIVQSIKSK